MALTSGIKVMGGRPETSKPCHPAVIRQLFERGLVKGKIYAIDGTGLKDRYLLMGILNVYKDRALWLNWRVLKGDASEKGKEARIVRDMVNEILAAGGSHAM